ncbi:M28 family peptidase [Mycolicibacterium sediminis]|uniref:Peptidase M28 n=1 Tax=Mycolicibacterium sediminis TaxID=1286180 RepID=A0A7I7QN26_9MYCO|nr:M28 family peptidase [Mycolicibacterium sediminis]BBY27799.1 peptidase M28 [Mycolicibacterium sediminis]
MTRTVAGAVAAVAVVVLAACSAPEKAAEPVDLARDLAAKVTVDGMFGHLQRLSDIADEHGGSRADGTPGYDASVDYVAGVLRDNGFDVETADFDRVVLAAAGAPTLTVGGRSFPVDQASLLVPTPAGGLTAQTLRPEKSAGCTTADYGDVRVRGAIVVVDDADCSLVEKQNVATGEGAVGLLVVSDSGAPGLFTPGYYQQLKGPVAVIGSDADAALRRTSARVKLVLDAKSRTVTSRNVLAQTKTGDPHRVIVAGTNLDSAPRSPGLNADGSGVAAVLETAVRLGSSPDVTNAVRFAFWGAGEAGQEGSTKYLAGLGGDGEADLAMYLNADQIGSTNAGYFTYDGDQSGAPNPQVPAASVPAGSAGIERTLAGYLNLAGKRPADQPLGRSGDYAPFLAAGIPIGGITTGAAGRKTEVQARLWGGQAGQPFDPAYRTRRDTIANVDRDALGITGPAVAFVVGTYAASTDGPNGLPSRG